MTDIDAEAILLDERAAHPRGALRVADIAEVRRR